MKTGTIWAAVCVAGLVAAYSACGGSQANVAGPTPPAPSSSPTAPSPKPHPLANSPMEAQSLIQDDIDGQMATLWKCVKDYQARVGDPQREVLVDLGIDEDGILMGVTTATPKKGELEPKLKQCLFDALRALPFPRSHAGIITVRESFREQTVAR
jgi:hypothetical protein